ncbi:MAG: PP2C family protein-serine/threonine phosphatase [Candidatus Latescibacterota bacterium]|nr:PP2C family protein-serine/threonine phosphatase [Candidatus Latescibacterota bacterium]
MEAAIPMVQFASILEVQMEREVEVAALFARRNDSMHRALTKRTFVCFTMGELDPVRRHLRLSNGGCPYPYHFRVATGEVEELQIDAYPLGVRAGADYEVVEVELEPGDRIVFCSDGIVEAGNGEGKIFGFESAEDAIRLGCLEGLSAAELAARLMAKVDAFSGAEPQGDDQTVVVLRVE